MSATSYIPKVKICGLRDGDSAVEAARAGADYLGFNLVEGVRRQLTRFQAQEVVRNYRIRARDHRIKRIREKGPQVVGLFRNQDARWVNKSTQQVDLDCVQLCGEEDDAYIRSMWKPVLRQVRVKADMSHRELEDIVGHHLTNGRIVLLDRYDEHTPGGSGKTFDWSIAEGIANHEGVLLAGGLHAENVGDAIRQLTPWGVDVSTGVETDGIKDHAKIKAFVEIAKSA